MKGVVVVIEFLYHPAQNGSNLYSEWNFSVSNESLYIEQRFYITVYIYPPQGCPVFFFKSVNETLV